MSISRLSISFVAVALLGGVAFAQVAPSDSAPSAPAIAAPNQTPLPPIVSFMRSSSGWSANFSFADPVTEIQWSTAKEGPFESTGFLASYDPLTRRPAANSGVELDGTEPVIYVRYADLQGNWIGPFAVPFDPVVEIQRWHRSLLEITTGSWLAFRHDAPDLLYYTHISGYRCGIREFRIGLDTPEPDRVIKLAPCDMSGQTSVDTHLYIDPKVMSASAQLVYQDGTVSKVKVFLRR
jgi:hypothetical protein